MTPTAPSGSRRPGRVGWWTAMGLALFLPNLFFVRYLVGGESTTFPRGWIGQLFPNGLATAFAVDVIAAAGVFMVGAVVYARRRRWPRPWLFVPAAVASLAFALVLFAYLHETRAESR